MPLESNEQQDEAWNCNDVNSIIKRTLSIPSKVAIAQTPPENQTGQLRGLTNETTQSPENQTGQLRGLTNETTN